MTTQPEALRLADVLELAGSPSIACDLAAAELRRLHAENAALKQQIAPAGWKLAPVEPTDEMEAEGNAAIIERECLAKEVWASMLAAAPAPEAAAIQTPAAVNVVIEAMRKDPDYAWSWHCNIAMAFVDAGGDRYTANQGAAGFMRLFAGVEPAHELPPKPEAAADARAVVGRQLLDAAKQAEQWITQEMISKGWGHRVDDPPQGSHLFNLRAAIRAALGQPVYEPMGAEEYAQIMREWQSDPTHYAELSGLMRIVERRTAERLGVRVKEQGNG